MITLTVAQIKDLAEFAGLTLHSRFNPPRDELDDEITIAACPESGTKDDEGNVKHYAYVAYMTDYPEEGCFPLGDEITKD
jgi:hypothetical protein